MFGWSRREREEAAQRAAKQAEKYKHDWIAWCVQSGFTDKQAAFLFELTRALDAKIGSRNDSSAQKMMAVGMMYGLNARPHQ